MTVDYSKFRPGGNSSRSCGSGVVSPREHIKTSLGTQYAALDLAYASFSVSVHKAHRKELLSASKASDVLSLSDHGGIPTL